MEQSKAVEYESREASSDVLKPRNIYVYVCVCVYIHTHTHTYNWVVTGWQYTFTHKQYIEKHI